jgi:hypothetical protein
VGGAGAPRGLDRVPRACAARCALWPEGSPSSGRRDRGARACGAGRRPPRRDGREGAAGTRSPLAPLGCGRARPWGPARAGVVTNGAHPPGRGRRPSRATHGGRRGRARRPGPWGAAVGGRVGGGDPRWRGASPVGRARGAAAVT